MLWWEKYVGIPFQAMGRDESGVDCVGLGILMMKREKGVAVDDTPLTYTAAEMRHFRSLHRIDALIQSGLSKWHDIGDDMPHPLDLVLYTVHGIECHAAMVIDTEHVLHVEERHCVHVAPLHIPGYVLTRILRHATQM